MEAHGPRELGREDFVASRPATLLEDEREAGDGCMWDDAWAVAPGYELREPGGGAATRVDGAPGLYLSAEPPSGRDDWSRWKQYLPLRDEPDLFLRFARLAEGGASPDGVVGWAGRYGLLGCGEPAQHSAVGMNAGWFGRPEESIELFVDEAERAATVLSWCEALSSGDGDAMFEAMQERPVVECAYPRPNRTADLAEEDLAGLTAKHRGSVTDHYDGDPLLLGADYLAWEVNVMIRSSCYRFLRPGAASDAYALAGDWGFTSLLGAMYLQVSWLIEARGGLKGRPLAG